MSQGYQNSGRKSKYLLPERLGYRPKPPGQVPTAVRKSQQRWIRNEADERAFENGFRFNEALALHAVEFFPRYLRHSQGKWAGEPFELADFHRDEIVMPLFGWVGPEGFRRFTATYLEEPKKQGKSAVASGIGLYTLVADEEEGAHNYSFGADRDQARVVHSEAISMVEWSPELEEVLEINRTTGEIRYPAAKSFYKASSATTRGKHGIKMHVGIFDELHEWYGRKLWDQLKYAGRSRAQPIRFVITNAGDDVNSVCYDQRQKALRIEAGETQDDSFLCHVLRVPEADARAEIDAVANGATELPVARQCNPMLGTIITERALVQDIRDAIESPSELPNLLRLTYGIWASSAENPLLQSGSWEGCEGSIDDGELLGAPCAAALDLAEIHDPCSFSIVWPGFSDEADEDGSLKREYKVLTWTWIARKNALANTNPNKSMFAQWEHDERARLTLTRGEVTDFSVVRNDIIELCRRFGVTVMLYDPRQAEKITQEITEGIQDSNGVTILEGVEGLQRIAMAQSVANYGEATREFETVVLEKRLTHDGNPLLAWEAGHCSFVRDKDGNKKPVKPGGDIDPRKVDGIQTTVMGINACMHYVDMSSAYAGDGDGVVLF